uniref:BHLH domain-containing protein n=1 Tax=Leersia perrieri TaxID=77586 RepID=A0A0D9Y154_9ORYZ
MNGQDSAAAGFFTDNVDDSGKSAAIAAAAAENEDFSDMLRDFDYSSDDLFELMWQLGRANFEHGDGGRGAVADQPSTVSYHHLSQLPPETITGDPIIAAPSEEEMAAWLCPIVSGDDSRQREDVDGRRAAPLPEKKSVGIDRQEAAPTTTNKDTASDDSGGRKNQASSSSGGTKTRSHHAAGAHNLTEKRRRLKITERLRTLKRLVPGCDKTDQATTLDQTIQYMKLLQHQVNTMPPPVYPRYMTPPPQMVLAAAAGPPLPPPAAMVPFARAMIPYPPYPAAVLLPPPPMYRPAATSASPAAHRHGSGRSGRISKSSSSTLRKKQ